MVTLIVTDQNVLVYFYLQMFSAINILAVSLIRHVFDVSDYPRKSVYFSFFVLARLLQ